MLGSLQGLAVRNAGRSESSHDIESMVTSLGLSSARLSSGRMPPGPTTYRSDCRCCAGPNRAGPSGPPRSAAPRREHVRDEQRFQILRLARRVEPIAINHKPKLGLPLLWRAEHGACQSNPRSGLAEAGDIHPLQHLGIRSIPSAAGNGSKDIADTLDVVGPVEGCEIPSTAVWSSAADRPPRSVAAVKIRNVERSQWRNCHCLHIHLSPGERGASDLDGTGQFTCSRPGPP